MRFRQVLTALGTLSLFAFAATGCGGEQATGETPDPGFTYPQDGSDQAELLASLVADEVPGAPAIVVEVTPEELYPPQEPGDGRLRVGTTGVVGADVSFEGLPASELSSTPRLLDHGAIRRGLGKGFVWTGIVSSPDATAVRLHFTDFSLPKGAELYLYSDRDEVVGPYTGEGYQGDGEFWSHTLRGSVITLQLRYSGSDAGAALDDAHFQVSDLGHFDDNHFLGVHGSGGYRELCSYNEPCVEDASCYSNAAVNAAKHAVAHMEWVSGAWLYYCSGGLIADSDTNTQVPYFLTAHHCISKAKDAKSLEAYFQYWTASCGGACYDPVGAVPRTLGADLLATGRTGDFTLMRLREDAPEGSVFLGWNATPVGNGDHLYRVSHPNGAPQAYSEHVVDYDYVECGGLAAGEFIYSQDVDGATEGGSSGSPVFNASGQIVGQLYGACGYTLEVCDAEQNRTVDGALATYYCDVAPWLNPDDPDCGGGGGGCAAKGESCTDDADCCSNKCKGRSGAMTCK